MPGPLAHVAVLAVLAPVVLVPFGQAAAPSGFTGAYGTARPTECAMSEGFKTANAWERAKEPNLRRYCDLLASGTAKLVGSGSSALVKEVPAIADEADKLLPNHASSSVLKGRALLRLGRPEDALAALQEAKRRDERALDDPVALLAWARANARMHRLAEAAEGYRAALPRASALSAQDRSAAAFEAGMTVMEQGPAGIDDAVAMFRQARRDAQDAMQVASVVALALALDRAGQHEPSKAVLAEHVRSEVKGFLGDPRVLEALTDAGAPQEKDALVGLALESLDPAAAKEAWRAFVAGAGGKGVWADHGKEHAGGVGASVTKKPAPAKPARTP